MDLWATGSLQAKRIIKRIQQATQYEPWHIRYIDDAELAKKMMGSPILTLEEWLDK